MKEKYQKIKSEKEFTPEQERELMERLEKIHLNIEIKIEFLLVWKGEKPATEISIATKSWKEGEPPKSLDSKQVEEMEKLIKDMKLFYNTAPKQVVDGEYYYITKDGQEKLEKKEETIFYLAKKKENLDLFIKALKGKDDKLFGQLYGYPESAIKAYIEKGEKMEISKLPSKIQRQPSVAFTRFKLSKNHWQQELKTSQRWAEITEKTSLKLYEKFINYMRTVNLGDEKKLYIDFMSR